MKFFQRNFGFKIGLAVLTSFLYFFSSPSTFNLGLLSFIALVPFFWSITNVKKYWQGALLSFVVFFLTFLLLTNYLIKINIIIWVVVGLMYSLIYYVPLGLMLVYFNRKCQAYNIINYPAMFVLVEWSRNFGAVALPFGNISSSLYQYPYLIQIVEFFGEYSVSFLVVIVNISLLVVLKFLLTHKKLLKIEKILLTLAISIFILNLFIGIFEIRKAHSEPKQKSIKVLIINSKLKSDIGSGMDKKELADYSDARLNSIIRSTNNAINKIKSSIDLIIWGEASVMDDVFWKYKNKGVNYYPSINAIKLKQFISRKGIPVLLGGYVFETKYKRVVFLNSTIFINSNGEIKQTYEKNKLIILGEYIPSYLRFLIPYAKKMDLKSRLISNSKTVFNINGFRIVTPICFENGFNSHLRELLQAGNVDLIANMSDDSVFHSQLEAKQHFAANVFRAIENRTNVVEVSNFGINGKISKYGIISENASSRKGYFLINFEKKGKKIFTIFSRYGNLIVGIIITSYMIVLSMISINFFISTK